MILKLNGIIDMYVLFDGTILLNKSTRPKYLQRDPN